MPFNVLIVDDSKLARMVVASTLRRIRPDWRLQEATSAQAALDAIAGGSVDVALVDFNMPGTDGLELLATNSGNSPEDAGGPGFRQPAGRDSRSNQGT